nr:MAG TPA: hypothetical protein [Caudoviricetes sp.]
MDLHDSCSTSIFFHYGSQWCIDTMDHGGLFFF